VRKIREKDGNSTWRKRNWKEGQEKGFEKDGHREWRYENEKILV
jgi:hypothetical protein